MTPMLAKAAFVVLAVAWFVIRMPHARRARRVPVARSDRGPYDNVLLLISLSGLGIVPLLYVATGFPAFAEYSFRPAQAWAGVAVAAAALWLFYLSHRALGRNWSVSLEVRQSHRFVTEGVYGRVRHPMYAAFWLWALAQALLLPNWVAGPAGILGFGTLFFGRIGREERMMLETFGAEYREYMSRTDRIIPGIF
jgi:protein-S-isoprenylcysteine O-methyltransferase Ste14